MNDQTIKKEQELPLTLRSGIWWPEGYVTDPDGKIIPPAGRLHDFKFGYDQGYSDGMQSIKDSVKAIEDRVRATAVPEGYKLVPLIPTIEMYNAACIAFCKWEVLCDEECRAEKEFSQPNFTHSDAYQAMLAAVPDAVAGRPV